MVFCDNDDDKVPNVTFKATTHRTSEVPSNASATIALDTLTYNPNTKVFFIGITHNLAVSTAGHIYKVCNRALWRNCLNFPKYHFT